MIRHEVQTIQGTSVSFQISPEYNPQKIYQITTAFTVKCLALADYSYLADNLRKYKHMKAFQNKSPLLLIGADHTHLITPIAPVCMGPPEGPAVIKTKLGWTLEGPARLLETQLQPQQYLFLSSSPTKMELEERHHEAVAD
ncbi:hypothetical protein P4O66_002258 [Electrophorus voltai]|uniref:Uncharacterized protein n=1 Tax=Electrophorus voltai TaxID=2609070 RepID=A0AAD9DP32_9TELE|nr:hypothetical protein P4O66_002258 [Electrophorus voltai]